MWVIETANFKYPLLMLKASTVLCRDLDFSGAQTKNQRFFAIFLITFVMSIADVTADGLRGKWESGYRSTCYISETLRQLSPFAVAELEVLRRRNRDHPNAF